MLVLAGSGAAGRLVAALRRAGFAGTIVGGAPLARERVPARRGRRGDGRAGPASRSGAGPAADAFARSYARRWGEAPDEAALRSYDAVRLVVAAVRRAGLNRARDPGRRARARALGRAPGASFDWDARGRNQQPVALGVVDGAAG